MLSLPSLTATSAVRSINAAKLVLCKHESGNQFKTLPISTGGGGGLEWCSNEEDPCWEPQDIYQQDMRDNDGTY